MKIDGVAYRTIWLAEDGRSVEIIDQTRLPHEFAISRLKNWRDAAHAISQMLVRGAPLIGVTAAYGLALAMRDDHTDESLAEAGQGLRATRPTAVNLAWALDTIGGKLAELPVQEREQAAYELAQEMADDDVATCRRIGEHGLELIKMARANKNSDGPVNILTHCNAGWLATVDYGTALSPIYHAHDAGLPVHVWVDETRPRNQGAGLTAWELGRHGVPHTVIADNTGGHLMQHGKVDICITGSDRTTWTGDVCNKIGTYLKALAAHDNNVPFYVALPHTTLDWDISDGVAQIPIEERQPEEVTHIWGLAEDGSRKAVRITPDDSPVANYAFDVTPARLVSGLITERGICPASKEGLLGLYPERNSAPV